MALTASKLKISKEQIEKAKLSYSKMFNDDGSFAKTSFASLPSHTGASIPSLLERRSLEELVLLWSDEYYNASPILQLFDEDVRGSEQSVWETVIKLFKTGDFTTGPEAGQILDLERVKMSMIRVLYQQYAYHMDSNQAAILRNPGTRFDQFNDTLREAVRALNDRIVGYTEAYWRTLRRLVYAVLTGVTTVPVNVSGVASTTLDFGVTVTPAGTSWLTRATNIMKDFQLWLGNFRELNGGMDPNNIIINHRFHEKYILDNEILSETFAVHWPAIMQGILDPLTIIAERLGIPGCTVHKISDIYEASGSNEGLASNHTQMWHAKYLTMLLKKKGEKNLQLLTARTEDNDYKGGITSYSGQTDNPKRTYAVVCGNHIPVVKNTNQLQVFNLQP